MIRLLKCKDCIIYGGVYTSKSRWSKVFVCLFFSSSRRIWRDTWASQASPTKCTESLWNEALSSLWWLWVRKHMHIDHDLLYIRFRMQLANTELHSTCNEVSSTLKVMDSVFVTVITTTQGASCLVLNACQFETTFLTFGLNAVWITAQETGVEWQWFHILFILKNARTFQWSAPKWLTF